MDRIRIRGGQRLKGSIPISGAKNAVLTLLPCALLTDEPLTLRNLPRLSDVDSMGHLLNQHGVSTMIEGARANEFGRVMTARASRITSTVAPYDIVRKMRASILVLGPLLAREGVVTVSLPGGCAIGNRPIDLHLKALEALGAQIELSGGYVQARAPKGGLRGGRITFPKVSVGATENALMAAVLAQGESVIENAAREPEITDLAKCLTAMGAKISGIGSEKLTIQGVAHLHGATHAVMPDRIEAGSYACAAAATDGDVELLGVNLDLFNGMSGGLFQAGVDITPTPRGVRVRRHNNPQSDLSLETAPYPGFPTDMQAQLMALLTMVDGVFVLTEEIFENRYMHVPELTRMGANIIMRGRSAVVRGVKTLTGAQVMATDLRASMGLIIAGLMAEGETLVNRVYHLDRGYERLEEKLSLLGGDIARVPEDDA